ncbi:MAG TPA: WGR domain-containing protein [Kofleriaceae bacterium]|nr:WGR domain-containing protein [Kofleriaceae bacterium]
MPRYEFSEGTSSKFWEIKLAGASFTTTYGKIGAAGQTTLKEFKSAAEAKKEYDKLIAEKTRKGYVLVGDGGAGRAPADDDDDADADRRPAKAGKPAGKAAAPAATPPASSTPGTPGARYFELVEGTSSKFWEIRIDDTSVITRYGKIGTAGQTTEKELDSKVDAFKEHDKLIAEKVKKGYVEQGAAGAAGGEHRNPELEKAIELDPYDTSAYMVYADWLQGQGDPRGELISLQLAAESKRDGKLARAAAALIERKADYFLGPLAPHTKTYDGNDRDAFTWRSGFIHAARLSYNHHASDDFEGSMAEVLELLLRHPSGRFVTELVFGFNNDPNEDTLDDLIAILARKAPPTLRKLHLGEFEYPDETEMSWYHVGNVGKLWKAVPRLRSLIVQGGEFELGTIELPELTHAEFRTGGLSKESARAIAKARWPNLESLEVWYGDDNYGGTATVNDAVALLARADLRKLTLLGLMNTSFTDELCGQLAASPLLPQLTTLDLSMGTMTDDGARALAASKDAFRHLVLEVSDNYLTKAGLAALKGIAKTLVSTEQRDDDDPEYRHPSVGE